MNQGLVKFTGIDDKEMLGCDYTRGHGTQPGVATVTVRPNFSTAAELGTLTLTFDRVKLQFKNCAIVNGRATRSTDSAFIWQIRILDRRWSWQYSFIHGRYNVRDSKGDIDDSLYQEKTPQQLATLLFEAMGETNVSVESLPNETRPEVDWSDSRADSALESLLGDLGCRVVLPLDDKPRIVKLGEGKELPEDDDARSFSVGHEKAAAPGKIRVAFAPTVFEAKWVLKPVGEDTDGTIKYIGDLSYIPDAGWGHPGDVDPAITYERDGEEFYALVLASKTVYRYWKIAYLLELETDDETVQLTPLTSSLGAVGKVSQVVLRDVLARPDSDGKSLPAFVEGIFTRIGLSGEGSDTPDGTRWPGSFTIDKDRQLVILGDGDDFRASRYDAASEVTYPAALRLHCSYTLVADEFAAGAEFSGGAFRHVRERTLSRNPGVLTLKAPYLSRVERARYEMPSPPGLFTRPDEIGTFTNKTTVNSEADKLMDQAEETLKPHKAQDIEYRGLRKDIDLDGAIQQITYSVGNNKPTIMRCGRNNEPSLRVKPYEERRRIDRERARELEAGVGRLADTATFLASALVSKLKSFVPDS